MTFFPELYAKKRKYDGPSSARLDQYGLRLGMWYWKEETKTLEFKSFTPAVELKEKGKKGKAVHFAEMDGATSERLTDKRFASRDEKSVKASEKKSQQGNVTLEDVKFVALFLLQDTEMQRVYSFTTFMRNKNLDSFLMALLYYMSYYLEKISIEKKPQSYMVGLVEKKEIELVMSKLEDAQKYLAQKYCVLVLGIGMADKHHMNCGKEKISDTQKDWKFFESFYTFCTCVAWVVFRRQYLREIEEEIGRLFRTNMFNIPRRRREDEESGGEKKRMTLVQFRDAYKKEGGVTWLSPPSSRRRMMAKRPAIKKAMDMRSPVLSTLLPSLREKAQHIAEKKYVAGIKLPPRVKGGIANLESVPIPVVGILGEPRNLFNPHTLLPRETEENGKQGGRSASVVEKNNTQVQETLNLVMATLSLHSTSPK
ncbi:protein phosphatase 1 regulatory subunit 36 isoform X2 [Meriones unguiculatus]|uniref:protein phosphatase 1 regulatory subunit 36 isoform X2 n=1 Tax=Meriones unguiculatus TaxID=10047 RepID=UPI00293E7BE6|nr:protein phosphatase 1 regulatory subunit 36 isoform X2 [Meriones unguiculatus]